MLEPIYTDFGNKFSQETLPTGIRAAVAKIDCDAEREFFSSCNRCKNFFYCWIYLQFSAAIASRYQISKYPTLKVYRFGSVSKREYRGARTTEAFIEFMRDQMKSPIRFLDDSFRLHNVDVIGKLAAFSGRLKPC